MQGLEKNAELQLLTNDLFWCRASCPVPCHQPRLQLEGALAGWIHPLLSTTNSSGEITEVSPCHSAVWKGGQYGIWDELGAQRLPWSTVDPCLLQICLSGLGPALLLSAEHHIFMRGRCFSPPACPTALPCLWGILCAGEGSRWALCVKKVQTEPKRVQRRAKESSGSSLEGKKRC